MTREKRDINTMVLSRVMLVLGILTVHLLEPSFGVLPISPLKADRGGLAPGSPPRNVRARLQSTQTILIEWDEPEIPNGVIQGYKVYYTTNPDLPVGLWMIQEVTGNNRMATISGLIPNSTYTICVLALNIKGQGPLSVPVQVMNSLGAAPIITNYAPDNMKVMEDAIVSFFCKASGYPPPAFQWEREGKTINNFKNKRYDIFYMPQGTVLRIHNTKAKDGTYFTCVAKNEHGEARANATLTVYEMEENVQGYPRIIENPMLGSVDKDQTATLVCLAQADNRDPPKINWLKDSYPLEMDEKLTNGENRILQSESGTLTIKNAQEKDHGKYECVAENEVGVAYSSAAMLYFKVQRVPPHFYMEPEDVYYINPNTRISIPCSAVGSPMPVVKWRHGYQEVNPDEDPRYGMNHLNLTDVLESVNYTCVAESELGSMEKEVRIVVQALPRSPAKLIPSEITSSSIKLSWKPGNSDDISYIIQYKVKEDPGEFLQILGINDTEYTIQGLQTYRHYEFRAIAVTEGGRSNPSSSIEVVTREIAPGSVPRNVRARPQSRQTIRIDWDEPEIPNGKISGYKVFYSLYPDLPVGLWMTQEVIGDNRMATISGLIANGTYTICVLAFSSMGQGPLSVPVQVINRQEVPLQPRNLHAKTVSPYEIEVIWDAPDDVDKIVTYTLYYNDSESHQKVLIAPPTTKYKLTELIPSTIYHIQLEARSVQGERAMSIMVKAQTGEFIPNEPKRVEITAVNSTTIHVKWRLPKAYDPNGLIRGYYVDCTQLDENNEPVQGTDKMVDTNDGNRNEVVITGLRPDTRYQVSVAGYTRRGFGARSRPRTINTNGAVPSEPRELTTELIQTEPPLAQVSWFKPEETNGEILGYKLLWGHMGGVYQEVNLKANQSVFLTPPLDFDRVYVFRVMAKNDIDFGDMAVTELITDGAAPRITIAPDNMKVMEDATVSFFCKASGYPPPAFQWEREGKTIYIFIHRRYDIFSMPHGTVLRIRNAKANDGTYFTCVAKSWDGEARANATLTVYKKEENVQAYPRIIENPMLRSVEEDQTATMVCSAQADNRHPPKINWLKDGIPLEMEETLPNGENRILQSENGTLTIKRAQEKDHGKYECVAQNEVGVAYSSAAMLYVREQLIRPPVILIPSEITSSSIKLSWKPGNSDDVAYIILFKIKQDAGEFREIQGINATEYSLKELQAYQQYEFRVVAVTKRGRSNPSSSIEVVTRKIAPGSPPRNVRARPQSPQTILIDWDEPELPNGEISGYKVLYAINPDLPIALWMNQEVTGDNKMATIIGLIPNSTYTICVLALNSMGEGPISAPEHVMTKQRTPLAAPRNVRARPQNIQPTIIYWDEPEISNEIIQGYKVFYTTNPDLPFMLWMNQEVTGDKRRASVSGLVPNSTYAICVMAFSRIGMGQLSVPSCTRIN